MNPSPLILVPNASHTTQDKLIAFITALVFFAISVGGCAYVLMVAWNDAIIKAIPALAPVNFWQAVLMILFVVVLRILFQKGSNSYE
jgi:hypothetical protein